jgi:hypothetical protein
MRVLDIGAGIRPQTLIECDTHIVAEPHGEYVDWLHENRPDITVCQMTWQEAVDSFPEGSVDWVTLLDVIEHVEREEAERLLAKTLPIASKGVIVFTPYGFNEQEPGEVDAWGMHGGEWQRHRSGWIPDDFPGWDIELRHGPVLAFFARLVKP